MSSSDKIKLNGIDNNANNYTHPSYTAISATPSANQTPAFGNTFKIPSISRDATGHIGDLTTKTVKIPAYSLATTSADGLMSSEDKYKVNNCAYKRTLKVSNVGPGNDAITSPSWNSNEYYISLSSYWNGIYESIKWSANPYLYISEQAGGFALTDVFYFYNGTVCFKISGGGGYWKVTFSEDCLVVDV